MNIAIKDGGMKQFIRVMKALSDPSRVQALKLLEHRPLCVCELQVLLGLAQSTVSKHMKNLEDAGLVSREKKGTWIIYRLADGSESVYAAEMLARMPGWLNKEDTLIEMILNLPAAAAVRNNCPTE